MPAVRMRKPLILSDSETKKLQRLTSSRTESHSRVMRARMLLAYAAGENKSEIARQAGVSRPTVKLCIEKVLSGGIEVALDDLPRSGRPPEQTVEDKL